MTRSLGSGWVDVSVTLRDGMPHWPGNPPIRVERILDMGRGDEANLSKLTIGVHSGTHMDGPVHFVHDGAGLDDMPLSATMGEARVVEIVDPWQITADELCRHQLAPGERVLFRTANSTRCWQTDDFVEDFVHVAEPAALHLAQVGVQTVGIDYLSVGGYHTDGPRIHRILMDAGIWIIEGLDLRGVPAGRYDMICLPVKLQSSDGAPARALLRPLDAAEPDSAPR